MADQQQANQGEGQPAPESNVPARGSALIEAFYPVENLLKLYFLVASVLLLPHTDKVALAVCLMAVLRQLKLPKFNKEYLMYALSNAASSCSRSSGSTRCTC